MKYHLLQQGYTGISVPKEVFDSLKDARETDLKVILYILQTKKLDPLQISTDMNITLNSANSSMLFWADKGVLACEETLATENSKKKKAVLSSSDIIALIPNIPEISVLSSQLQSMFGYAVNENTINKFIALFVEDNIPVDVILTISLYWIKQGQDNPSYILKVISTWFKKYGVTSGVKAEEYIALSELRNKQYLQVCKVFSLDSAKLKSSEKTIINSWYEKLNMSLEMIQESYYRAGHLANILYCNGILKSWSNKGYTKISDLKGEISNISQSPKNIDKEDDLIVKSMNKVPIFNKGE